MRISQKRSLIGYSSKSVKNAVASMRLEFEEKKRSLEAELDDYNRINDSMLEEITLRKQEVSELAGLEKNLEGLVQQTQLRGFETKAAKPGPLIQKEQ